VKKADIMIIKMR